eukprot:g66873.t1
MSLNSAPSLNSVTSTRYVHTYMRLYKIVYTTLEFRRSIRLYVKNRLLLTTRRQVRVEIECECVFSSKRVDIFFVVGLSLWGPTSVFYPWLVIRRKSQAIHVDAARSPNRCHFLSLLSALFTFHCPESQEIVKVCNKWTHEAAKFNIRCWISKVSSWGHSYGKPESCESGFGVLRASAARDRCLAASRHAFEPLNLPRWSSEAASSSVRCFKPWAHGVAVPREQRKLKNPNLDKKEDTEDKSRLLLGCPRRAQVGLLFS